MAEIGAHRRERGPQVAENLHGLRVQVAGTYQLAVAIERDLAGDIDGPSLADFHDVRIADGGRQIRGTEKADVRSQRVHLKAFPQDQEGSIST